MYRVQITINGRSYWLSGLRGTLSILESDAVIFSDLDSAIASGAFTEKHFEALNGIVATAIETRADSRQLFGYHKDLALMKD